MTNLNNVLNSIRRVDKDYEWYIRLEFEGDVGHRIDFGTIIFRDIPLNLWNNNKYKKWLLEQKRYAFFIVYYIV